jgi:hypothetical protein
LGNWHQIPADRGALATLSSVIASTERRNPGCVPDLRSAPTLLLVSDYGGAHSGSKVETYSFLALALDESFSRWEDARRGWRQRFRLGLRRLEFKSLGDRLRGEALGAFLLATSKLNGLLLTVIVEKSVGSFFHATGDVRHIPLSPKSLERAGRIVHLGSVLVAGLCAPAQNVVWFTDQDEIAPNDDGVRALTTLFAQVASNYLEFDLGHFRCGTTKCDGGDLWIEDLAAIPDLAAGATADLVSSWLDRGWSFDSKVTVPPPQGARGKSRLMLSWLSAPVAGSLGRVCAGVYRGIEGHMHVASVHVDALD